MLPSLLTGGGFIACGTNIPPLEPVFAMTVSLSARLNRLFEREIATLINGIGDPLSATKTRLPLCFNPDETSVHNTRGSARRASCSVSPSRRVFVACALHYAVTPSELHSARARAPYLFLDTFSYIIVERIMACQKRPSKIHMTHEYRYQKIYIGQQCTCF